MKQGMAIQDLAAEITRQYQAKVDLVQDTPKMEMTATGTLLVDDAGAEGGPGEFPLLPLASDQIADWAGIPRSYYRRLQGQGPKGQPRTVALDLLATNVNYWFNHNPGRRLVRTLDGKARAYLSDRYLRIDNYDLAQVLLPVIQEAGCQVASCNLSDSYMHIKAVVPGLQREVTGLAVGSTVQAGVMIKNSEVGLAQCEVAPFTEVLQCTNGMTHTRYGTTRRHVGKRIGDDELERAIFSAEAMAADDKAYMLAMRDVVRSACSEVIFDRIVADMQAAADPATRLAKPLEGLKVLGNRLALEDGEVDGVLGHLISGGDLTGWGVANAITRYAQDVASYDRASELEAAGDTVVALAATPDWKAVALAGSR